MASPSIQTQDASHSLDAGKLRTRAERNCNICGHRGLLDSFGYNLRTDAKCPKCGALERHRLLKLWCDRDSASLCGCRLLHFAAEDAVGAFIRPHCKQYLTADLIREDAQLRVNIEALALKSDRFDVVICFHVLEHVDDRKALAELHRILVPGGLAILAVPVIEGWDSSYENATVSTPADRLLHFGQEGHLRRYGRDVRERIRSAGFTLAEFVANGDECAGFALQPGERLFLARKRLNQKRVSGGFAKIIASAPGRIDVGGRLDIPRYFFQFAAGEIGTTNIAISLRTTITYVNNYSDGIIVRDGQCEESGCVQCEPANTSLPYFWRAIRHFGASGGIYTIHTQIPPQSGLGGSSAFVLALLGILARCKDCLLENDDDRNRLLILAYLYENAIGRTSAGFQDYSASMWGNAHFWSWGAALSQGSLISSGEPICSAKERHLFDGCILLAFTGEPHPSNRLGPGAGFELAANEKILWLRVGELGKRVGALLRERAWRDIATAIREEREVWLEVSGEQMSPKVQALIAAADACGVGARFAGIPSGGTVWAIGSPASVAELRERWDDISGNWPSACVLNAHIDTGLELTCDPAPLSERRPSAAVSLRR